MDLAKKEKNWRACLFREWLKMVKIRLSRLRVGLLLRDRHGNPRNSKLARALFEFKEIC